MESAIPAHLACRRTQPANLRPGWNPPGAAFTARFPEATRQLVMAYFGVQYRAASEPAIAGSALAGLAEICASTDGPRHVDRAGYTDESGFRNILVIAYWDDPDQFDRWFADARPMWLGEQHISTEAGFFVEVVRPTVSRFETIFSNDRLEGVGVLSSTLSGEMAEHGYWGSTRDRLAIAQTDPLDAGPPPLISGDGIRQVVRGQDNLCLIRSGQDWSDTDSDQRRMYLEDIEPTLRAGMDFLRDEGRSVGCYANRYMQLLDESGNPLDKSFGMSWWRSLAELNRWASDHATHRAIFGQAIAYLTRLGPQAQLRLHHEVTVVEAAQQHFEYLGCHSSTGMLRAAQ